MSALAALLLTASFTFGGAPQENVASLKADPVTQTVRPGQRFTVMLNLTLKRGWHVYTNNPGAEFAIPALLKLDTRPSGVSDERIAYPEGEDFSGMRVWTGRAALKYTARAPAEEGAWRLLFRLRVQPCSETTCLPPQELTAESRLITIGPPVRGLFAAGRIPSVLELLAIFVAGLGLNLTPCVYPVLPITVGYFARQASSRRGTLGLALAYFAGMVSVYSGLGVFIALSGRLFGSLLQSPWVVGGMCILVVGLALSMFGLWEIRVPVSASVRSGGWFGALLLGAAAAVVAAPCVGPVVGSLLVHVAQSQDPVYGLAVFLALSSGLALPYLVLGMFTGWVSRLPASGMWMEGVKKVFGVLLLGLAAFLARPVIGDKAGVLLAALVVGVGAVVLIAAARRIVGGSKPAAVAVRVVSALMLVGAVAASLHVMGQMDIGDHGELLSWSTDLEQMEADIREGRPVLVDFYAQWCLPCKELDLKTFSSSKVVRAVQGYRLYKVDLTKKKPREEEVRKRFGVVGVPVVIVFSEGKEVVRFQGFVGPEDLARALETGRQNGSR